ncbi:MAG: hypothetical protein PHV32_13455 [Eubacteriales bacterium]|nr:hypothetical protein [Eubacteriales bacterium]
MIFSIISTLLLIVAIACFLDLNPERVTGDIMKIVSPQLTMREKAKTARHGRKTGSILSQLSYIRTALANTGKAGQFSLVCSGSLVLFLAGCVISVLVNNLFLFPVLSVAMALIPFFYVQSALTYYDKHIKEELETALSIISTSYIRSDDIIAAVSENIIYIKPPIREIFKGFLGETTAVSSDVKRALNNLKNKIDNEIFKEWCNTLLQCQDDRTLKDTLLSVVGKLTDVRIVNNELKTILSAAKNEYWVMVLLVVMNIPLLYMLNKSWFETLLYSFPGKLILGICGTVILITALFMKKYTKPVEYKR